MKDEQKKLKRKLTYIFWMNILILAVVVSGMIYHVGINGKSVSEQDFVIERFGIITAILVIPLSLKLFHNRHKKIIKEDIPVFLRQVYKLFLSRMLALDFVVIVNLAGFYIVGALNFVYMAGITLMVFILCYPVESVVDPAEAEIKENE